MERDELVVEIASCYEHPEGGLAFLRRMELTDRELANLHELSPQLYLIPVSFPVEQVERSEKLPFLIK